MDKEAKTILVTGGTGFIGQALCKRLITLGYKLYVLTRSTTYKSDKSIIYVNTLSELGDIDIDIIINLAGETISKRWTKTAKEQIYNSRILTTRNIVNYIKSKARKPALLISGSAIGYYGTDAQRSFNEESDVSNTAAGFAHALCRAWEEEALQAETLGVRVVRLRIAPVLGKGGGIISKLLPSFYLGLGSQIADGTQWFSWIDLDDLIDLILFCISNPEIHGSINAAAPTPVTNKDFSLKLAKAINRPCFLKTPAFFFKLVFGEMAEEIMLNGQKVLPQKALEHGFSFSYPSIEQSLAKIFKTPV